MKFLFNFLQPQRVNFVSTIPTAPNTVILIALQNGFS